MRFLQFGFSSCLRFSLLRFDLLLFVFDISPFFLLFLLPRINVFDLRSVTTMCIQVDRFLFHFRFRPFIL